MAAMLLCAFALLIVHGPCMAATALARLPTMALGVNGHHFTQPNYFQGDTHYFNPTNPSASCAHNGGGSVANGVSVAAQLDEVQALSPQGGRGPIYYRHDVPCDTLNHCHAKRAAATAFVKAAKARNITVLPILLGIDTAGVGFTDHEGLTAASEASAQRCAELFVAEGITTFEIGQEWDTPTLITPGTGEIEKPPVTLVANEPPPPVPSPPN